MTNRREYAQQLERRLKEWNAQINRLNSQAEKLSAESKAEVYKRVENVKEMEHRLKKRIEDVNEIGEDKWADLKLSAERAEHEFRTALEDVKEFISGQQK